MRRSIEVESSKKKIIYIVIAIIGICTVIALVFIGIKYLFKSSKILCINEVCTKNEGSIADPNGKYYDYIEIYNNSDRTISLQGYGLTDDMEEPYKYTFPSETILLAKHRILIYATKKGNASNTYYTGFSLDTDIENTLYLSDGQGKVTDKIVIPVLKQDIAYGYAEDGIGELTTLLPSPGEDNTSTGIYVDVEEPTFSIPAGFCRGGEQLVVSTEDTSLIIYYTLDNTTPTKDSIQYTTPIILENPSSNDNTYHNYTNVTLDDSYTPPKDPVDKAVVMKAFAVDEDGNQSDIITNTYFVDLADKELYQDGLMISLTTEPDNLFDDSTGIYVTGLKYDSWNQNGREGDAPAANFQIKGDESERPAYLEIYDQESNNIISQNIGIRIQGASNRQFAKKRFSLFARKDYGTSKYFPYDFFGNGVKSHSLLLRNTAIDAFSQSLMEERNIGIQRALPVHVFLEGEYWGDYYLQEKYSDDYIEQYYKVDNDNVIIIKNDELEVGEENDMYTYRDFYNYIINTDMSEQSNYDKACTMMDMQSYIDYVASQVYLCNMDWNSIKLVCWRARETNADTYGDG